MRPIRESSPRLRIEIPSLSTMKEARGFEEFWRTLNNDEVDVCQLFFERVTGQPIYLLGGPPQALWAPFRALIEAIGTSTYVLNYLFDILAIEWDADGLSIARDIDRLHQWVHRKGSGADPALTGVIGKILKDLRADFVLGTARSEHYTLNALIGVKLEKDEAVDNKPSGFDFFISYKHARYFEEARQLLEELQGLGFKCWLDREQLGLQEGARMDPILLKRKLKDALSSALCTIFFETYDLARADEDFRGEKTVFNWQTFERRYANRILVVRPDRGEMEDLVRQFAAYGTQIREAMDGSLRRAPRRRSAPELSFEDALDALRDRAARFFSKEIEISPPAALALLAPGAAQKQGNTLVALSDDVLINLLRYSPYCALELTRAGWDLRKLFAVGVKINDTSWQPPGRLLLTDIFEHALYGRVDEARLIGETGVLDEGNLLTGILELAVKDGSAVQILLLRTLRLMANRFDALRAKGNLEIMIAKALSAIRTRSYSFPGLSWEIHPEDGAWRIRPCSACGIFRVADLDPFKPTLVRAHAVQKGGVFASEEFRGFQELFATNATVPSLEEYLARNPVLRFTIGSAKAFSIARIHELPAGPGEASQFFLECLEPLPSPDLDRIAREEGSLVSRLLTAIEILKVASTEQDRTKAGPEREDFPLDELRTRTALILGRSLEPGGGTLEDAAEEISLFDLHVSVLAPLWEYQKIRDLDYDSF